MRYAYFDAFLYNLIQLMQADSMGIEVRKQETPHEISLSKEGWLEFLSILSFYHESAVNEDVEAKIKVMMADAKGYVLSPNKTIEHKMTLHKTDALDLYLFLVDFKEDIRIKGSTIATSIIASLRIYLVGGQNG